MIEITATSSAIEELWRIHASELIRFATVLVGPSDASDIVADSFLAAAPVAAGAAVANKRAYLFLAVSNQAHRLHRTRERRWIRDLSAVGADVTITSETPIDVRRAVASLSLNQRTVVYLAYWEDLPERAIADLLEMSSTTVHRHLTKARSQLRKALL